MQGEVAVDQTRKNMPVILLGRRQNLGGRKVKRSNRAPFQKTPPPSPTHLDGPPSSHGAEDDEDVPADAEAGETCLLEGGAQHLQGEGAGKELGGGRLKLKVAWGEKWRREIMNTVAQQCIQYRTLQYTLVYLKQLLVKPLYYRHIGTTGHNVLI